MKNAVQKDVSWDWQQLRIKSEGALNTTLRYLNIIYLESKSGVSPWRVEAGGLHDQIYIFKSHKGNSIGDGLEEQQTESREPHTRKPCYSTLGLIH